jgi:predicted permease
MGLFPSVAVDPVLTLTVLLMSCMPPAQNSVLMLQVVGDTQGATQMSRMLFVLYSLSVVPMSLMLTLILGHVRL